MRFSNLEIPFSIFSYSVLRFHLYFKLRQVNQQLLEENERLKVDELISSEIPLYPDALKKPRRFPFTVKKAHVLKNSFQNQRNYLTIDMELLELCIQ